MKSSSEIHADIQRIAQKEIERSDLRTPFKSTLDSAYAGGEPKTIRPGEAAAGTDTKKVLATYAVRIPVPSEPVVEIPLSNEEVAGGVLVTPTPGLRGSGAFYILPDIATLESNPATQYGSGVTNNAVICQRLHIPGHINVASVHIEVTTGAASALASVGLYSSDGAVKIVDSGTFDCSTTGTKSNTLGAAVDVDFGWYWYVVAISDNTIRLRARQTGTITAIANAGTVQRGSAANSASAGVLPSTLGVISALTFTVMALAKIQS